MPKTPKQKIKYSNLIRIHKNPHKNSKIRILSIKYGAHKKLSMNDSASRCMSTLYNKSDQLQVMIIRFTRSYRTALCYIESGISKDPFHLIIPVFCSYFIPSSLLKIVTDDKLNEIEISNMKISGLLVPMKLAILASMFIENNFINFLVRIITVYSRAFSLYNIIQGRKKFSQIVLSFFISKALQKFVFKVFIHQKDIKMNYGDILKLLVTLSLVEIKNRVGIDLRTIFVLASIIFAFLEFGGQSFGRKTVQTVLQQDQSPISGVSINEVIVSKVESEPKKTRGRARKVQETESQDEKKISEKSIPKKTQQAKSSKSQEQNEQEIPLIETPIKRKRGRPSKADLLARSAESSLVNDSYSKETQVRRRGATNKK